MTYAQRAKVDRVTHEYFRLPIFKTEESKRQYRVEASITFAADYKLALIAHEEAVQAAEDEYQIALQKENDKSIGSKLVSSIALDEKEIVRRTLPPFTRRNDIPSESEIKSKINLQGFKKVPSGGNLIFLEVYDYDVNVVEKTSNSGETIKYYAEITLRQPIWVRIETADGEILFDEIAAVTDREYEVETSKRSSTDHRAYMNGPNYGSSDFENILNGSSYRSWLDSEKRSMRTKNLKILNEELNSLFGYAWIEKTTPLYTGSGKKMDYSDLDAAQLEAKHGLQDMNIDKEKSTEQLNNAIQVWLKIIDEELESDNKKARINHKVGASLYINCAVAYIYLDQYDKANEMLNYVEGNDDFKGGDIREAETLRQFVNDNRKRME